MKFTGKNFNSLHMIGKLIQFRLSLGTTKPEDQSNYRLTEIGKIKDYFN